MAFQEVERQVGDTHVVLAATLKRPDGTVVDLTGLTAKFAMIATDGTAKVAETAASITDITGGQVQYQFLDADVDTVGTFYAYFITETTGGKQDTFPAKRGDLRVKISNTYWCGSSCN